MRSLISGCLILIACLTILAMDPTPLLRGIDYLERARADQLRESEREDYYQRALAGHLRGEVYWTTALALSHIQRAEYGRPGSVLRDSTYGINLLATAVESGYSRASLFWYMFVDRTAVGLERSARGGSLYGVQQVALLEALGHCDVGELPSDAMDDLWNRYAQNLDVDRQWAFVPTDVREEWAAAGQEDWFFDSYDETRVHVLVAIPSDFDALCDDREELTERYQ